MRVHCSHVNVLEKLSKHCNAFIHQINCTSTLLKCGLNFLTWDYGILDVAVIKGCKCSQIVIRFKYKIFIYFFVINIP